MNHDQVQQEISIIKNMIEKTKRETAESGHLFIFMGIAAAVFVLIISLLELYKLFDLILPAMIALAIINGIIGFFVVTKIEKKEKATTYPKTVVLTLWFVCSMTILMLTFLFPFLNVYPFRALPVLVSLILGIAVFISGVIYEMRAIQWLSLSWWIGACLMALSQSEFRFLIMIASIVIGWIIPGGILNKQYKNRSTHNES